jgi:hypothetical protein
MNLMLTWSNICFNFYPNTEEMSIISIITVNGKTPQELYEFMLNLDKKKYLDWHKDHKDFKIIKQEPAIVGSIFYFEEYVGKTKVNYDWEIASLKPNEKIILKAKYFYDITLELIFTESGKNNTVVTHNLKFGSGNGFSDYFVKKIFLTETFRKVMQKHAEEEFKALEIKIEPK